MTTKEEMNITIMVSVNASSGISVSIIPFLLVTLKEEMSMYVLYHPLAARYVHRNIHAFAANGSDANMSSSLESDDMFD